MKITIDTVLTIALGLMLVFTTYEFNQAAINAEGRIGTLERKGASNDAKIVLLERQVALLMNEVK